MRVIKEMYPLCCISLEGNRPSGIDQDTSTEPTLLRTGSAVVNGSDFHLIAGGSNAAVGVAGRLYKWTNYHKGWRSRWFTLRNGVISYSKSRTQPENIAGDDVRLIGDVNYLHSSGGGRRKHGSKPAGIVHLKVYNTGSVNSCVLVRERETKGESWTTELTVQWRGADRLCWGYLSGISNRTSKVKGCPIGYAYFYLLELLIFFSNIGEGFR